MTTYTLADANEASLYLFSVVVARPNETAEDTETAAKLLNEYNVVLSGEAAYAYKEVYGFVRDTKRTVQQLNATFYRKWQDVVSRTRLELFIDQILHYASTYGTGHSGEAYIPASAFDIGLDLPFEGLDVRVIEALEQADIEQKTLALLSNGTALSEDTIFYGITILRWAQTKFELSDIRNREAKTLLIAEELKAGNAVECEPEELLRAAIYTGTYETLLIKNAKLLTAIEQAKKDVSVAFSNYGVARLAAIFNRYKAFFIAFKRANAANKTVINKISKLSKAHHKPLPANPLNAVSSRTLNMPAELHLLKSATIPARLRALNICAMAMHDQHGFVYNIRNGKLWIADRTRTADPESAASQNFHTILDHLKQIIGSRFSGKRVYIPEGVEYGLPISEKQMAGNIPYGTRIIRPASESVAVGIYWDESCRCKDLDLSGTTLDGTHISWDSRYKQGPFVYSGDMTELTEHGATEYILCRAIEPDEEMDRSMQLRVNCYTGKPEDHEYDIIIGTGDDLNEEYMMNPANRIASFRVRSQKEMSTIGVLQRTKEHTTFVLTPGSSENTRVANSSNKKLTTLATNAILHKLEHGLSLKWFMEALGADVVRTKAAGDTVDFDLGLDRISKDFFNLLYEGWEIVE